MPILPKEVKTVIAALQNAGYSPYLVGGCVREMLRGKEPSDYDMTSDAPPGRCCAFLVKARIRRACGTAR